MSTDTVTNPIALTTTESKSARKKRVKAEMAAEQGSEYAGTPQTERSEEAAGLINGESANDSSYIKEIQRNIRNVNKKLNLMSKVTSIMAENPNSSLDELLASRKINADQKAQALKRPALQTSLTQLEEQLAQYKKIDAEYQSRISTERETLTTSHQSEIAQLKETLKNEVEADTRKTLRKQLLTFSQFLRAAAAKRAIEEEADSEESKAFEGALLLVYGGDEKAVDAAESIINGSDEAVPSVDGQTLSVKYSQIKQASLEHAPEPLGEEEWTDTVVDSAAATQSSVGAESIPQVPASDPTIANAGLTELDTAQPNGVAPEDDSGIKSPVQGTVGGEDGANTAGSHWDTSNTAAVDPMEESFEMIPRDPAETENPHEPGAPGQTESWADDSAAAAQATIISQDATNGGADDGFHEVERRGRGGHRGVRGDGDDRGRGRGGRGRGGHRGDRGGDRGGRGGFRGERGERRSGGGEHRGRGRGAPRP